MELDDRKVKILQAIIKNYLETGEPVGSRTISSSSRPVSGGTEKLSVHVLPITRITETHRTVSSSAIRARVFFPIEQSVL